MSISSKFGLGAALAATALTAAAPADAQYYRGGYGGGYRHGGGDAAAGAIVGGIIGLGLGAAIAGGNRNRYYDRGYYDAPPPRRYYDPYAYNRSYYDEPRCYTQFRYDPYYGQDVRVRVCR